MNLDNVIGCKFYGSFQSCEKCGNVKGSDYCEAFQLLPTVERVFKEGVNE